MKTSLSNVKHFLNRNGHGRSKVQLVRLLQAEFGVDIPTAAKWTLAWMTYSL